MIKFINRFKKNTSDYIIILSLVFLPTILSVILAFFFWTFEAFDRIIMINKNRTAVIDYVNINYNYEFYVNDKKIVGVRSIFETPSLIQPIDVFTVYNAHENKAVFDISASGGEVFEIIYTDPLENWYGWLL